MTQMQPVWLSWLPKAIVYTAAYNVIILAAKQGVN